MAEHQDTILNRPDGPNPGPAQGSKGPLAESGTGRGADGPSDRGILNLALLYRGRRMDAMPFTRL